MFFSSLDLKKNATRETLTVLVLLQKLSKTNTTLELLLGGSIQVRAELCESSHLTVLGELELHRTGDLLHGLGLGSGSDTRHRQTDVDGWTDTLVEQLALQEDLARTRVENKSTPRTC